MATTARRAAALFAMHAREKALWRSVLGAGVAAERERLVPHRYIWEMYPQVTQMRVPIGDIQFKPSNMDPYEVYCLSALAAIYSPRLVFEFGTYDGATSLRMASLLPGSQIVTLDLPDGLSEIAAEGSSASAMSGYLFRGTAEGSRIYQLLGDSRTFDFSDWYGKANMVIIDAGHTYDCVSADTASALELIAPGGLIVWDDYCSLWPDVVRVVDQVAASGLARPVAVRGTEMAVWDSSLQDPNQMRKDLR